MSLRLRLILSYVAVASLVFIVGIVGIITAEQITNSADVIIKSTSPSLTLLGQIEAAGNNMRETVIHHALFRKISAASIEDQEYKDAVDELKTHLEEFKAVTNEPDAYEAIAAAVPDYVARTQHLLDVANTSTQDAELYQAALGIDAAEEVFQSAIDNAITEEQAEFQLNILAAQNTSHTAVAINLISIVLVLGAALALGVLIARRILQPIVQLQTAATRMMNGDYSQRASIGTNDEIGQLSTAFNMMSESIQKRDTDLIAANSVLEKRVEERTKELRVATREAQEASRLKDEFLAIMSHELRTPLNAMLGFQGILLMTAKLDDRSLHMVRRSQANANRLLTLINDILDVSRIESGRMQFVKSNVSLADLIERLQSQMGVLADEKLLKFNVNLDPALPPTIFIDEDAITKIVTNLLGNAFKFTEKGSVTLDLSQKDNNLVIAVTDTGIGIPPHMHDAIFERFRQVDGSSKRTHGGSGLGLAIVQKLAVALNGTINVQSVVGEGSTFTAELPLETVNEAEKVAVS
ncbi:MAG: HAMP domain-containing protein [Anaerolineaceae bacterium]|nr:HAMP domain-containing protein [Anaerolineaceae bacterium]